MMIYRRNMEVCINFSGRGNCSLHFLWQCPENISDVATVYNFCDSAWKLFRISSQLRTSFLWQRPATLCNLTILTVPASDRIIRDVDSTSNSVLAYWDLGDAYKFRVGSRIIICYSSERCLRPTVSVLLHGYSFRPGHCSQCLCLCSCLHPVHNLCSIFWIVFDSRSLFSSAISLLVTEIILAQYNFAQTFELNSAE
jgi:hypothetical protein